MSATFKRAAVLTRLFACCLALLPAAVPANPAVSPVSGCEGITDAVPRLACAEREAIVANPGRALRYGAVLLVLSGKKIHPRFNWAGTPATPELSYFYQAFDARLNAHVLRYVSGESVGLELIHDRSGQHLQSLGSAPNFAPGGEIFATISDPQQARVNEVQIWRAGFNGFANLAKVYPQGWKPATGPHTWLDADTLQVTRACDGGVDAKTCGTVTVKRSGSVWKIAL